MIDLSQHIGKTIRDIKIREPLEVWEEHPLLMVEFTDGSMLRLQAEAAPYSDECAQFVEIT